MCKTDGSAASRILADLANRKRSSLRVYVREGPVSLDYRASVYAYYKSDTFVAMRQPKQTRIGQSSSECQIQPHHWRAQVVEGKANPAG